MIAPSSGEAEFGSLVKGSAELMCMRSLLSDSGVPVTLELESDATAAIGIVGRESLGKVRHLDVEDLWVQSKQKSGEIAYKKVSEKENTSDAHTKGVHSTTLQQHTTTMGFRVLTGLPELAPQFAEDDRGATT